MNLYFKTLLIGTFLLLGHAQADAQSCRIKSGDEALNQLDYFKAKKTFYKALKYCPEMASFGLSIIYSRDDNPFYDLDSAYRYVVTADTSWAGLKEKKKEKWIEFNYTRESTDSMLQVVSGLFYIEATETFTVDGYTTFLQDHSWSTDFKEALYLRDSIAYYTAMEQNSAEAFKIFLEKYPTSEFAPMANDNYYNSHFYEKTADGSLDSFLKFLEEFPESPMRGEAERKVYTLVTAPNTLEAYELFVLGYSENTNAPKAWDEFFQLYIADYSKARIQSFIDNYPEAPNLEGIEQELAWVDVELLPIIKDGKYGFMGNKGKLIITPSFDFAGGFNNGLAVVVQGEMFGFIDKFGHLQIPCEYSSVDDFHEGRAVVERDGKLGMIDRNNNLLLPFIYEEIGEVSNHLTYVSKGVKYGYADWNGQLVIPEQFDEAFDFIGDLAKVEEDGLFGMINAQGEYVIPAIYENVTPLSDSLMICKKSGKHGVITNNGTVVIQPVYDQIGAFMDGLAIVAKTDTVEYINIHGEIVISKGYKTYPNFLSKGEFKEGTAVVYRRGKYGKVNTYGNVVTDIEYDNIGIGSVYFPFQKSGGWGLMSASNKVMISALYESIDLVDDKYVIARKEDSLGVMDLLGNILLPFTFNSVEYLIDGTFAIRKNGQLGLFDAGTIVAELEYEQIGVFNNDFVFLLKGEELKYYDIKRNTLIELEVKDE
ncbi:MAG: WG repeat-containing protein [Crocinitomicaceae bacterium]|nr:WG repeat-containing protein [Crocinitomicaceae bacterium]